MMASGSRVGETVNLFLHTWLGDILLSLMAHGLLWEGFWTTSVIIVLLVISSSGWENINLITGLLTILVDRMRRLLEGLTAA